MSDDQPPGAEPGTRGLLQAAGCVYTLLLLAALVWLGLRDALSALPRTALGTHGPLASAAAGLAVGLLGTWVLAAAARRLRALRAVEDKLRGAIGGVTDHQLLGIAVFGALAEEMFFRLAVLDALGLEWSVALYVLLNTGPGLWAWAPVALVMAVAFGAMVEAGLGLLSVTLAHAVINYLTFRRIFAP